MDKQKTITIKINGKDRLYKQGNAENEGKESKTNRKEQQTSSPKVTAWNETAAAQESADDSFDWVLPDPLPGEMDVSSSKGSTQKGFRLPAINREDSPKGGAPGKKNSIFSGVFPRIFSNVFLAVIIGLGFGFIILNTVTSNEKEGVAPNVAAPGSESPAETGTAAVELTPISTFVLQEGVYTTEEAAQTAVQSLESKGIQAQEFANNDKFAVFMATASTLDQAKAESTAIESKGIEVFAKPFDIAGVSVQGLTKEESEIAAIAPDLYKFLSAEDTSNADSLSQVEAQLAQLQKVDEKKIQNKSIMAVKQSLEKGAAAYIGKQKDELEKQNLSFLAAWQSLGK